ncbi:MAG: carboxypeptidase-like regulatory domain-containing protein, partial [Planctomycetota bacterium]|nr:carboxypeptidase-like regulatory domain-containing protein [Planctomycetota bacterium]
MQVLPSGPHGRVIDAGSGEPVSGLTVRLRFGRKVLAEAITGEDGGFALPRPERSRRVVDVHTEGWRTTPARIRLDEAQSAGESELLFEAERIVSASVRGRLVDARTGGPVPEFLIEVRGPRGPVRKSVIEGDPDKGEPSSMTYEFHSLSRKVEDVVTDAYGFFETAGGFEAGIFDLALIDHPSQRPRSPLPNEENRIEHEHAFEPGETATEKTFEVEIGPTYRFDLELPDGLDLEDLYATFPNDMAAGLRVFHRIFADDTGNPAALLFGAASSNEYEPRAPLRAGTPIWTRFLQPVMGASLFQTAEDFELAVRSEDGLWSGGSRVRSVQGIYPEVVPIELVERGVVEGTVQNAEERPVRSAWIQVAALEDPGRPVREVGADRKARFRFDWLDPGDYRVLVETERYEDWAADIRVEPGSTKRLEVELKSVVPLGVISGTLRSRTGRHRSKGGLLSLKSLDDPDLYFIKSARYRKREGEYVAPFSFDDVPVGTYELTLDPLDNMRWSTLSMTVSPPAEGLEFICEDDTPTFDLGFRAFDAETGR